MDKNRKVAYDILLEIEEQGAYSNLALNRGIEKEKPDSPNFVRAIVYGVLERKITLDFIIESFLRNPIKKKKAKLYTLLRMGVYQIFYMDSVPDYSGCNETVELAKKVTPGLEGFVNGVLRSFSKEFSEDSIPKGESLKALSIRHSFSKDIIKLWIDQLGVSETISLMEASNLRPPVFIRPNKLKIKKEELKEELIKINIESFNGKIAKNGISIKGDNLVSNFLYKEGYFSFQDEASIYAIEKLKPGEGDFVLDLCAAPGGKSMAVAEEMMNKGNIFSFDTYPHKIKLIEEASKRLGITIVRPILGDSLEMIDEYVGKADKVIVDPPCSGLGVIRRRPEIKYKKFIDEGLPLSHIQYKILSNGGKYLKPNGRLLYSTCTINQKENEDVINRFLSKHSDFNIEYQTQLLPDKDGTDGFYICILTKNL